MAASLRVRLSDCSSSTLPCSLLLSSWRKCNLSSEIFPVTVSPNCRLKATLLSVVFRKLFDQRIGGNLRGTVAKWLEHLACSVEGMDGHCLGSLSKSITDSCSAPFCRMVVYALLNSRRKAISNAIVFYRVVFGHFCLFYAIEIHIGNFCAMLVKIC